MQNHEIASHKELIIFCDESSSKGRHFSDFYGGALIGSGDIDFVRTALAEKKLALNLFGEIKWTKITENYAQKYIDLMDCFFDFVEAGKIKLRIMFTQNMFAAGGLSKEAIDNKYFMLYYQFIKHAFGLKYATTVEKPVSVRIYLDKMPDTIEKVNQFRNYLVIMANSAEYRNTGIRIAAENIAEVVSHEHTIIQCLDVILGAVNFRLNDMHKEKPVGKSRRGKRTVAKERVYKHINGRIRRLYENFNIGITTGTNGDVRNRWRHSYRHWRFLPANAVIQGKSKR